MNYKYKYYKYKKKYLDLKYGGNIGQYKTYTDENFGCSDGECQTDLCNPEFPGLGSFSLPDFRLPDAVANHISRLMVLLPVRENMPAWGGLTKV